MGVVAVVDDDSDLRMLLKLRLTKAGHSVVVASDGQAGLESIRSARPDLVIVDWMMPRLTGIEVCRIIRADPELERLPVLMLTSRVTWADQEIATEAGANKLIGKPFSLVQLANTVDELIAGAGPGDPDLMLWTGSD